MITPTQLPGSLSTAERRALLAQLLRQKAAEGPVLLPLSYGQRALWFLYQLAPHSAAYNFAFALRLPAAVDVAALQHALQQMVDRHPALRTTYTTHGGEPVQEVQRAQRITLQQEDARHLGAAAFADVLRSSYQQPFDLEHGPVLRATLYTRAAADHVLLLTVHHIAFDLWSLVILLQELFLVYAADAAGMPPPLPRLEAQYGDYVQWQDSLLHGPRGDALWTYWRQCLAGDLPVMNLPTDRPHPPVQTFAGAVQAFRLEADLTARLKQLARGEGVTLFMVLMAAYQVLLHRYSGQDDLLVGTPMLGRSRPEHRGLIGYFANPVVVRSDLSGNPPFTTYLQQVRQAVIGAIEHQDFPFPLLVERLNLVRDPARSPLFQTLFVLGKSQIGNDVQETGALPLEPLPLAQQAGQFELQMEIDEVGDALFGYLKYNTDLFDAATIDQMAGHFQRLVEGIVQDPACPIDTLPLLSAAERQRIMLAWNATETPYPLDRCLHEFIEDQVERTPDAPALICEETRLSYAELNRRANQLAHYLRRAGVGPETMVGVCIVRSCEMVISLLAVLKAGGAYVPFDPTYPRDHLAFMVADSQVPVLLTQEKLRSSLPPCAAQVIAVDLAWPRIAQEAIANPPLCSGPHNAAYMIYTSGSTGRPKGAINEHRGIVNRLLWMQDAYRLDASDRVLQKTPFSFDVSVWEFFWPLMTGACLVVAQPDGHRDPDYLVDVIQQQQITTLHFVPSMLETFLHAAHVERCTSIRRVICSGEALAYELQARFFVRLDTELHNLYGPTEAAVDVTYWACRQRAARPVVPIGRPIANIQMYVLDRYQQPVPAGVPGELYIGGIGVGRGYWNRPELTRERFLPDPFRTEPGAQLYRTGDLARFWPDGTIEYLGRLDHQVKIRGFRIELGEIETVLSTFPGVRATVVLAREDTPGDRRLVAYLVSDDGASPSISQLRAYLKERLPEYMVPSAFIALPELPLTPNGKVNRRALPAPEGLRPTLDSAFVAPRSELECIIARHWQEVLGVPQVGIHDNFFDLGGHSLRVAQLHRRLTEALGRELPLTDLFAYPTVAALAAFLESPRIDTAVAGVDARVARQQAALGRQKQRAQERRAQYG